MTKKTLTFDKGEETTFDQQFANTLFLILIFFPALGTLLGRFIEIERHLPWDMPSQLAF